MVIVMVIVIAIVVVIHPWAESFNTRRISGQTIHIYRGEAGRPPDPFYVASRAKYVICRKNLHYDKVPGGVVLRCRARSLRGKGLPLGDLSG